MGLYVLESRLEQHGLASYKGSLSVCVCQGLDNRLI